MTNKAFFFGLGTLQHDDTIVEGVAGFPHREYGMLHAGTWVDEKVVYVRQ